MDEARRRGYLVLLIAVGLGSIEKSKAVSYTHLTLPTSDLV
mgnify:CR=1 FL=1